MWTDPNGVQYSALPQRWRHAGRVIEIAGSPAMARRLGWAESDPESASTSAPPMSKLALRRALRARGLEEALNSFLASDPTALCDWQDSQVIRLDDPLMQAALPMFKQLAGLTDDDVQALVLEAQTA